MGALNCLLIFIYKLYTSTDEQERVNGSFGTSADNAAAVALSPTRLNAINRPDLTELGPPLSLQPLSLNE